MFANPNTLMLTRRIALACFVGVLLALPAFYYSFDIAAAGHGSHFAFYLFFGPAWLVWMLPPKPGNTLLELWLLTGGLFGLYGIYGGALAYARWKRVGLWAVLAIFGIHYAAIASVVTGFRDSHTFASMAAMSDRFSMFHCVGMVELFVALHLLAVQYARSTPPFRPRLTMAAIVILTMGLLAGVTLYVWGVTMD